MGDFAPESSDDEDEPTSVTTPISWVTNGSGIDFAALDERFERHVKAIQAFHPRGDPPRDAEAYVAFEAALADEIKCLRDEDGEFTHPLKAAVTDRRRLRKHLHRLLRALTNGEALALVGKAMHGEAALAALRSRYDARHSKAALSRVRATEGKTASPFDVTWGQYYKFEYEGGGDPGAQGKVMEVSAKNGCVVRETSGMTSPVVTELPKGTLVYAARHCVVKHNNKDLKRVGIARPCHGYVSLKMLTDTTRKPPKEFYDPTPEELAARAAAKDADNDRGEE